MDTLKKGKTPMIGINKLCSIIYSIVMGSASGLVVKFVPSRRVVFGSAIMFFVAVLFPCLCSAEEPLCLDGNPQYPLIYANAREKSRLYLDLDSCTLISGNKDQFEISAQYINPKSPNADNACRFRKNEASGGELQVLKSFYRETELVKDWRTIPNPQDREYVMQRLDEKGSVNFRLADYYMFKCAYRHLFDVPYKDDVDDDSLRRTVLILPREEMPDGHHYLWDDGNFPRIWHHMEFAWYLDAGSAYIEEETEDHCILRILVLRTPQFHYNDIMPEAILSERILYDMEENKMYMWMWKNGWHYMPPDGSHAESGGNMHIGEAAFYLAYGARFYGADPTWNRSLNRYLDVFDDAFYEHLEGEA